LAIGLVLTLGLSGCDDDPNATTTTLSIDQLQAAITQVQADIVTLDNRLDTIDNAAFGSKISTLQTTVNNLSSQVTGIQTALDNLNDNGSIAGEVTDLRNDLTSLANSYNELAAIVEGIDAEIDAIEGYDDTELRGLLDDITDRIDEVELYVIDLMEDIEDAGYITEADLEAYYEDLELKLNVLLANSAIYTLDYYRIRTGGTDIDVLANVTTDSYLCVTLYGSAIDTITEGDIDIDINGTSIPTTASGDIDIYAVNGNIIKLVIGFGSYVVHKGDIISLDITTTTPEVINYIEIDEIYG
jgi:hypothetical protein